MFETRKTLKAEYVREFIAGLRELALQPAPEKRSNEDESRYEHRMSVHITENQFYSHMLNGIRALDIRGGQPAKLTQDSVKKIAQSFTFPNKAEFNPLNILPGGIRKFVEKKVQRAGHSWEDAQVIDMKGGDANDTLKNLTTMRATLFVNRCFDECLALQEGTVQDYIKENITRFLEDYPHSGEFKERFGFDYLTKAADFSAKPQGMRGVFERARIQAEKTAFEREVAAENPEISGAQLSLRCQTELKQIAQKYDLPMPQGRKM